MSEETTIIIMLTNTKHKKKKIHKDRIIQISNVDWPNHRKLPKTTRSNHSTMNLATSPLISINLTSPPSFPFGSWIYHPSLGRYMLLSPLPLLFAFFPSSKSQKVNDNGGLNSQQGVDQSLLDLTGHNDRTIKLFSKV